ncbi:MAG: hypothetical protein ABSA02_38985 [Trebonia sp.]
MISRQSDEHAALVALLQARPDGLRSPEIAAELLEVGSAVEVWGRRAPTPALIDLPRDITPESAAEDVRSWETQGYRLLSSWTAITRCGCEVFSRRRRSFSPRAQ